jgi:hypothetical protein
VAVGVAGASDGDELAPAPQPHRSRTPRRAPRLRISDSNPVTFTRYSPSQMRLADEHRERQLLYRSRVTSVTNFAGARYSQIVGALSHWPYCLPETHSLPERRLLASRQGSLFFFRERRADAPCEGSRSNGPALEGLRSEHRGRHRGTRGPCDPLHRRARGPGLACPSQDCPPPSLASPTTLGPCEGSLGG